MNVWKKHLCILQSSALFLSFYDQNHKVDFWNYFVTIYQLWLLNQSNCPMLTLNISFSSLLYTLVGLFWQSAEILTFYRFWNILELINCNFITVWCYILSTVSLLIKNVVFKYVVIDLWKFLLPAKRKSSTWTRINPCRLPLSSYIYNIESIFDINPELELISHICIHWVS